MAAIVSNELLIKHGTVFRATLKDPLVTLTEDELLELCEILDKSAPGTWSGAVLSFLVEE